MASFLALAAIQIGVIILMRLITPKQKRPKAAPFEAPNVEEGAPIPVIFGAQQISGTVVLVADKDVQETHEGERSEYRAKMAYGLCWGPLDVLYDIIIDERSLFLQVPGRNQSIGGSYPIVSVPFPIALTGDAPVKFDVSALNMFGGTTEEGGVNGEVCIYRGTSAQPLDPLVQYAYGEYASRWPHLAYIRFGTAPEQETTNAQEDQFYWIANNPTPKPISFVVGRYPRRLVDLAIGLGISGYTDPRIGQDANPIEVWFEALTNRVWGMSESDILFNIPQLIQAAVQCKIEGRGISTTLADREADDFADDVMLHARAVPVENPETGLLEVHLLRPDYTLAGLVQLNSKNTENLKQSEGHFLDTLNQIEVKYRRFEGGQHGAHEHQFTAKFHHNLIDWQTGQVADWGVAIVDLDAQNIQNIVATRDRNGDILELTQTDHFRGSDYLVHTEDAWFQFFMNNDGRLQDGDIITITYESSPAFSGFVDATASSQNLANRQVTGYTRSETFDYTMFTQERNAQEMADFLRLMSSRKLAIFEWDMTREGSHLVAGDVVVVNDVKFRLINYPIRITRVSYGTPENPSLHFEGVQDVFGEQIAARAITPVEGLPPTIVRPPISAGVTLYCLGGAMRIGIVSTDPSYNIEIIAADDEAGTGAVTITPAGGIAGDSLYFDYAQPIDTVKWFRARLIYPTMSAGPLSTAISCTAVAGPPGEPTFAPPTWTIASSQDDVEGTATLEVSDPQGRLRSVEAKTQIGIQVPSEYEILAAPPYTKTVLLAAPNLSYIMFRITYIGEDGSDVVVEEVVTFNPNPPLPEPVTPDPSAGVYLIIPLHSVLTHGAAFPELPSEWVPLSSHGLRRHDLFRCGEFRINAHVKSPLPAGSKLSVQYIPSSITEPTEEDWKFLDNQEEPIAVIAVDTSTQIPMVSRWTPMALEARQEVVLRGVVQGGDGVMVLSLHEAFIEARSTPPSDPESETEDPCQGTTEGFDGYGNDADLVAGGWVNQPDPSAGGEMHLDITGGVNGTRAIRMDVMPSQFNYNSQQAIKKTYSGFVPGRQYEVRCQVKISGSFADEPNKANFHFGVSMGGAGTTFWFSGVPSGGSQDAWRFAGNFLLLDWVNQFGEEIPWVFTAPAGGEADLIVGFSSLLFAATSKNSIWVDDIEFTDVTTGEIFAPCSSGPTIDPGNPPTIDPCPGCPPPVLPPAGSRRLVLWGYTEDTWGLFAPFNGTHIKITPNRLLSTLQAARAANIRIVLVPFSTNEVKINGVISQSLVLSKIREYTGVVNYSDWLDVLMGIEVMDEPNSVHHWGTAVSFAVADGVFAKACKEVFGPVPLSMRYSSVFMLRSGWRPRFTQIAVEHYQTRFGTIDTFMRERRAAAAQLGIGYAWGLNPADGGSGESGIIGTQPKWWRMTSDEARRYSMPMARDAASYWFSVWLGTRPLPSWPTAPNYVAVWNEIVNALNAHS